MFASATVSGSSQSLNAFYISVAWGSFLRLTRIISKKKAQNCLMEILYVIWFLEVWNRKTAFSKCPKRPKWWAKSLHFCQNSNPRNYIKVFVAFVWFVTFVKVFLFGVCGAKVSEARSQNNVRALRTKSTSRQNACCWAFGVSANRCWSLPPPPPALPHLLTPGHMIVVQFDVLAFFLVLQVFLPSSRQISLVTLGCIWIGEPSSPFVLLDPKKAGLTTLRKHCVLNGRCPTLRQKRLLLQVRCKKVCPPPVDFSAKGGVPWKFKQALASTISCRLRPFFSHSLKHDEDNSTAKQLLTTILTSCNCNDRKFWKTQERIHVCNRIDVCRTPKV